MKLMLARIRRQRRLTKYKLHQVTGISKSYLTELESGKYMNPSLSVVCKLAKALECSLDELVDCEEEGYHE